MALRAMRLFIASALFNELTRVVQAEDSSAKGSRSLDEFKEYVKEQVSKAKEEQRTNPKAKRKKGKCPKGFGATDFAFPTEWKIPVWPDNMTDEELSELAMVEMTGFAIEPMNDEFLEGPTLDFHMQGEKTYWSANGEYFLYRCDRFKKWRIAGISGFLQNKMGECLAFVSDAYPNRDILDPELIKGWIEVEEGQWVVRDNAGVNKLGRLADSPVMKNRTETDDDDEEYTDNSTCPVMPTMRRFGRKAKKKAKEVATYIGRMFPALGWSGSAGAEGTTTEGTSTEKKEL